MRSVWVAAALALLGACSSSGDEAGKSDSVAGNEEAVMAAAQEQLDLFAASDYAGTWDMWTDAAKKTISREDYVELGETCDLGGMPLTVDFVRFESDEEAVVKVALGEFAQAYTMLAEGGEWRWAPTDAALDQYALGLDGAVDAMKAEGSC